MTCKDCIHYFACSAGGGLFNEKDESKEMLCNHFKSKSRYIELPCGVGDTLYDIYEPKANGYGNIRELKVTDIHIHLDKRNKPWIIISGYYFAFEDFGKTVFLTREEAEALLAAAAEKQMPKKPEHEDGPWSLCPDCGNRVCNDSYEAVNHITSYCERCGQALDWSEG